MRFLTFSDRWLKLLYMKSETSTEVPKRHSNKRSVARTPHRMTRRLAEERAVGEIEKPKFDGVALLRLLKK
jgi:hypothetical protein